MMTVALHNSLPQSAYTATQVLNNEHRVAESEKIDLFTLMERAGLAVFSHLVEHFPIMRSICILCGTGNNGGDGFVIARLACEQGWQVTVYSYANIATLKGEAKRAYNRLEQATVNVIDANKRPFTQRVVDNCQFECVIDCLLGIGFKGQLKEPYSSCIKEVNAVKVPIISVDIPSGLSATYGYAGGDAVMATQTVTFIVVKQGLLTGAALQYTGEIFLAELGIGQAFLQQVKSTTHIQGASAIPQRNNRHANCHKASIGLLLAVGGNKGMPGAIRMASESALRSGSSLVAVHCHPENHTAVISGRPELMIATAMPDGGIYPEMLVRAKAIVCGPGLGRDGWAEQLYNSVIEQPCRLVIDADALHFLSIAQVPYYRDNWVLTPHAGEAAKLLDISVEAVEKNRYDAVRQIAKKYGGVCVLKGAGSLISDGKVVWVNSTGNPGMATGGMGDVLSGTIAALLMQMPELMAATRLAVYVHSKAADVVGDLNGRIGVLASDLYPVIQQLLNEES